MTSPPTKPAPAAVNKSKLLMQLVVGALVGAGTAYGLLTFVGKARFEESDLSRLAAFIVAIVLLLMGLIVGLGTLAPKSGAHLLNVEDADELREQRRPLGRSSMIIILAGAALLSLALATVDGSDGMFARDTAAIILAIGLVGMTILSIAGRNDNDELMKAISNEGSTLAMHATFVIVGIWATMSHLGYVGWIDPLGLLTLLLVLELVAIFWVCAKRGLLLPR